MHFQGYIYVKLMFDTGYLHSGNDISGGYLRHHASWSQYNIADFDHRHLQSSSPCRGSFGVLTSSYSSCYKSSIIIVLPLVYWLYGPSFLNVISLISALLCKVKLRTEQNQQ